MGECPLQFFFQYVLGVAEGDDDVEGEYHPIDLGIIVHAVLEDYVAEILDRGLAEEPSRLARLRTLWRKHAATREAHAAVAPLVAAVRCEEWIRAIDRFLAEDGERRTAMGIRGGELEEPFVFALDVDPPLQVKGRFDRVLSTPTGDWIVDYKTSAPARLKERAGRSRVLAGRELQLALYWLARREAQHAVAGVEYVGIRPQPVARPIATHYVPLPVRDAVEFAAQLQTTLQGLRDLLRRGHYPLVSDSSPTRTPERRCGRCAYRHACRHTHVPTIQRAESDVDLQAFFDRRAARNLKTSRARGQSS